MKENRSRWVALLTALLVLGFSSSLARGGELYQMDAVHSALLFRVKHLGVSYVYGRFNDLAGSFEIDRDRPEKSRVEVVIQADSVDTHHPKRDKHLRSPDFLNAKAFPTLEFRSTGVERLGERRGRITGDLTLHGVQRPVAFEMDLIGEGADPWGGYRMGFEGKTTLRRSEFGMDFMPDAIGDEITVILAVEGVRQ